MKLVISNDIVMEIVSRLPLAELYRARGLSKFNAEASHESFYKEKAAKYGRNTFMDGFVFQDLGRFYFVSPYPNSYFDFSLNFVPGHDPKILATSPNGLVFVETTNPRDYRELIYSICKPATKQCKGIPLPRIRYLTKTVALFVLASNPLHFKILRLSDDKLSSKRSKYFSYIICEVFDSNTWRWKRLNDIVRDPCLGYVETYLDPVITFGSAHWKISDCKSIFAFDFNSENFSTISMPKAIVEDYEEDTEKNLCVIERWKTKLVEYKGKLGVIRKFHDQGKHNFMELWVMDNYSNTTNWTKIMNIIDNLTSRLENYTMPMAFSASDVSVSFGFDEVKFTNLYTNNSTSIKFEGRHFGFGPKIDMFPFITDFEPWNFHPPPRTINPKTLAKIIRKQSRSINYSN